MDRGWHRDAVSLRLHELQQAALAEYILEHDAVGAELQVAAAGFQVGGVRVVEMAQQDFVGERQWLVEVAAHDGESVFHARVNFADRFWG
jgi:hypothetical protein